MASQTDETIRLLLQVMGIKDLEELKAKAGEAKEAMEEVAEAAGDGEGAMYDLEGSWRAGAKQLQEFADKAAPLAKQAIGSLVATLSTPAGLTAAAMAAQAAFAVLAPAASAAWGALTAGTNDIPESTNRLERLNAQLKTATDRLKELADKQKLTNEELAEYNRLLGEQAGLEVQAREAKEDQTSLDALRRKEREAKLDKTAAADVQAAIGQAGGVDAVLDQLANQMAGGKAAQANRDKIAQDWDARMSNLSPEALAIAAAQRDSALASADKAIEAAKRADRDQAEALLGGAAQGDLGDVDRVMSAVPGVGREVRWRRTQRDRERTAELAAEQGKRNAEWEASRAAGLEAHQKQFDETQAKKLKQIGDWQAANDRDAERADKAAAKEEADKAKADEKAAKENAAEAKRQAAANAPGARLRAAKQQAYETAAGMALDQNNGEFNPAQLDAIARQAANSTKGLDVGSIQDAINQAAWMTRQKLQADLMRQMGRQRVQSNSYYSPW